MSSTFADFLNGSTVIFYMNEMLFSEHILQFKNNIFCHTTKSCHFSFSLNLVNSKRGELLLPFFHSFIQPSSSLLLLRIPCTLCQKLFVTRHICLKGIEYFSPTQLLLLFFLLLYFYLPLSLYICIMNLVVVVGKRLPSKK